MDIFDEAEESCNKINFTALEKNEPVFPDLESKTSTNASCRDLDKASEGANESLTSWHTPEEKDMMKRLPKKRKAFKIESQSVSTTGYEESIRAPNLPGAPFPVDRYHFHCKGSTRLIVEKLANILKGCEVDFRFSSEKCKFKCVKFVVFERIEFITRVYATIKEDTLLVELQRRSGNLLIWDDLYETIYRFMSDFLVQDTISSARVSTQKVVRATKKVKIRQVSRSDVALRTTTVKPVIYMIQSKFDDTKREGICALASLTLDKKKAVATLEEDALDALLCCLNSSDDDTCRCAVSVFANVAEVYKGLEHNLVTPNTRKKLGVAGSMIVEILSSASGKGSLELQRECARSLIYLGSLCSKDVMKAGAEHLRVLQTCKDERLAAHSKAAISNIC